eukprot:GHVP01013375.1.p1 GENE.GHVP01013375.1~~GHVP01013375.1.p1  ORF type:complete len:192 (+),score=39.99 GHVP01013375.1:325-900(+)
MFQESENYYLEVKYRHNDSIESESSLYRCKQLINSEEDYFGTLLKNLFEEYFRPSYDLEMEKLKEVLPNYKTYSDPKMGESDKVGPLLLYNYNNDEAAFIKDFEKWVNSATVTKMSSAADEGIWKTLFASMQAKLTSNSAQKSQPSSPPKIQRKNNVDDDEDESCNSETNESDEDMVQEKPRGSSFRCFSR